MGSSLESTGIQWHPGFYGAIEIELKADKEILEFHREYNLSKEPLRMDLFCRGNENDGTRGSE